MTPDFPRSAELLAARWEQDMGQHVDGVIAADPVGARYLLQATGPVTAKDGTTVNASDVVRVLLHDAYLNIADPAVDRRLLRRRRRGDLRRRRSGSGRHPRTGHGPVEGRVRGTDPHLVGGPRRSRRRSRARRSAARSCPATTPTRSGVFLNDGTGGKLDYYLTTKVTIEDLQCTGPKPTATVRLDLDYAPPANVARAADVRHWARARRAARRAVSRRTSASTRRSAGSSVRWAWTTASSAARRAPRPVVTSRW